MLFCKCTFDYISFWNKENSSNFLITVNKNLLYLKLWSLFQPPLQNVILYPRKFWCLFLKQTINALTGVYIWNLIPLYIPWIVMFLAFTNTQTSNNHKLLQPSSPFWLVIPTYIMILKPPFSSPFCSAKFLTYIVTMARRHT